jgi:hypothetical protein
MTFYFISKQLRIRFGPIDKSVLVSNICLNQFDYIHLFSRACSTNYTFVSQASNFFLYYSVSLLIIDLPRPLFRKPVYLSADTLIGFGDEV